MSCKKNNSFAAEYVGFYKYEGELYKVSEIPGDNIKVEIWVAGEGWRDTDAVADIFESITLTDTEAEAMMG